METSGTRHTLGSVAADIQSVRRREDLQGGVTRRELWWRQEAAERQLGETLVVAREARSRRQQDELFM